MKKRIEWIDTAKGICISLVVLHHTSIFLNVGYPYFDDFRVFRMPLYFILSGLFFKTYSGFKEFAIRKINKLIIPYLFFFVMAGVLLPIALFHFIDYRVWSYSDYGIEALMCVFSETIICNQSIWFLSCLFQVSVAFYIIQILAQRTSAPLFSSFTMCSVAGLIGLISSYFYVDLPYYIDSSLSSMPFFFTGYYIKQKTNLLYFTNNHSNLFLSSVSVVLICLLVHYTQMGFCSFIDNRFGSIIGLLQLYPYGILGTIAVLLVSKIAGTLPFISFVGRYSIIVLCTHSYLIQQSGLILKDYIKNEFYLLISTFVVTIILCALIIPLFKKYFPYVTAQKDLIIYKDSHFLFPFSTKSVKIRL